MHDALVVLTPLWNVLLSLSTAVSGPGILYIGFQLFKVERRVFRMELMLKADVPGREDS